MDAVKFLKERKRMCNRSALCRLQGETLTA